MMNHANMACYLLTWNQLNHDIDNKSNRTDTADFRWRSSDAIILMRKLRGHKGNNAACIQSSELETKAVRHMMNLLS
jgi:hypothetical protein